MLNLQMSHAILTLTIKGVKNVTDVLHSVNSKGHYKILTYIK